MKMCPCLPAVSSLSVVSTACVCEERMEKRGEENRGESAQTPLRSTLLYPLPLFLSPAAETTTRRTESHNICFLRLMLLSSRLSTQTHIPLSSSSRHSDNNLLLVSQTVSQWLAENQLDCQGKYLTVCRFPFVYCCFLDISSHNKRTDREHTISSPRVLSSILRSGPHCVYMC